MYYLLTNVVYHASLLQYTLLDDGTENRYVTEYVRTDS